MKHFEIHIDEENIRMDGCTPDLLRGLAITAANLIRKSVKQGVPIERATDTFCGLVRFEVQTGSVATMEVDTGSLEQILKRLQDEKGGAAQ